MQRRTLLLNLLAMPAVRAITPAASPVAASAGREDRVLFAPVRRVFMFDAGWRFHLGDHEGAHDPAFQDDGWEMVQLPHDWSIRLPFREDAADSSPGDYSQKGIGWYRKSFHLPDGFNGRIMLDFDGIYQQSRIWVNGIEAGSRAYGYVPFQLDMTGLATPGTANMIAVRVDNKTGQKARWYSGSGINRHVRLSFTSDIRIAAWGVRASTIALSPGFAEVDIEVAATSSAPRPETVLLKSIVIAPDGRVAAEVTFAEQLGPGETRSVKQSVILRSPEVWDPERPNLYQLRCEVIVGGRVVDDYTTTFGIRQIEWHHDFGLLLNGRTTKLRGVCLHTDCGMAGSAVPERVWERRLDILKSMGCNALRIAHHPAASELLDLCDRLGFLVIEEAFDKWDLGFAEGVEHPNFAEDWRRDLSAMLDRDRNRPSIVAWSVGNEAGMPGTAEHDARLEELVAYVREHETTRAVTCAFIGNIEGTIEDNAGAILQAGRSLDFYSLNYLERYFGLLRQTDPSALVIASESYPYLRSVFGGVEPYNSWYEAAQNAWVAGAFVWTGFDYLGESAGWPSRGWPNGLIDSCGYPKPQSDFFRSVWSRDPVVGLSVIDPDADADPGLDYWRSPRAVSHWNLVPGTVYAVQAVSNADSVELIVDGASFGEKRRMESVNQANVWHVRHQRGELKAVARNAGVVVAEAVLRSAGEAAGIAAGLDRELLRANGRDVCHVTIMLVDALGIVTPDADREVRLEVSGSGRLLGMDNGDLRSQEPYHAASRTTRNGRCLAIIQAGRQAGTISITASADGLSSANWTVAVADSGQDVPEYAVQE
jgi:beta-galactosidase